MTETLDGGQLRIDATSPTSIPKTTGTVQYSDLGVGEYTTLSQILQVPTLLHEGVITAGANVGDILYEVEVCPNNLNGSNSNSRVWWIAQMFRQWQADFEIQMITTKAIFQQLKILMAYIPGLTKEQAKNTPLATFVAAQTKVIFNPDNDNMVSLKIPFWTKQTKHSMDEPTGLFRIMLFQKMVVTQDTNSDLPYTLMLKADKMDLFYAQIPGEPNASVNNANGVALGNMIGPQAQDTDFIQPITANTTTQLNNKTCSTAMVPVPIFKQTRPFIADITNASISTPEGTQNGAPSLGRATFLNDHFNKIFRVVEHVSPANMAPDTCSTDSSKHLYICCAYTGANMVEIPGTQINVAYDVAAFPEIQGASGVAVLSNFPNGKFMVLVIQFDEDINPVPTPGQVMQFHGWQIDGNFVNLGDENALKEQMDEFITLAENNPDVISHVAVNMPMIAADAADKWEAFSAAPSAETVPYFDLQNEISASGCNSGRIVQLVGPGQGQVFALKLDLLGAVLDLASNIPIVGDIISIGKSLFTGANVAATGLAAAQTIVFDTLPDGNNVRYEYNQNLTNMPVEHYKNFIAQRKKQFSATTNAAIFQLEINNRYKRDRLRRLDEQQWNTKTRHVVQKVFHERQKYLTSVEYQTKLDEQIKAKLRLLNWSMSHTDSDFEDQDDVLDPIDTFKTMSIVPKQEDVPNQSKRWPLPYIPYITKKPDVTAKPYFTATQILPGGIAHITETIDVKP